MVLGSQRAISGVRARTGVALCYGFWSAVVRHQPASHGRSTRLARVVVPHLPRYAFFPRQASLQDAHRDALFASREGRALSRLLPAPRTGLLLCGVRIVASGTANAAQSA